MTPQIKQSITVARISLKRTPFIGAKKTVEMSALWSESEEETLSAVRLTLCPRESTVLKVQQNFNIFINSELHLC